MHNAESKNSFILLLESELRKCVGVVHVEKYIEGKNRNCEEGKDEKMMVNFLVKEE
ncbi:2062_t:CDS:1, partial [Acaulospora colombiana]